MSEPHRLAALSAPGLPPVLIDFSLCRRKIDTPNTIPVPGARTGVIGAFLHEGILLPLLDLATLLPMATPRTEPVGECSALVVRSGALTAALRIEGMERFDLLLDESQHPSHWPISPETPATAFLRIASHDSNAPGCPWLDLSRLLNTLADSAI